MNKTNDTANSTTETNKPSSRGGCKNKPLCNLPCKLEVQLAMPLPSSHQKLQSQLIDFPTPLSQIVMEKLHEIFNHLCLNLNNVHKCILVKQEKKSVII